MKKSIIITGVSTGIGFSLAKEFLKRGYLVFGSVRKAADAEALQQQGKENFVPLLFDVCDEKAILQAVALVKQQFPDGGIAGLINNAAIAVGGPLLEQPMEEIRKHFEVNIFGMLNVTRAFAPLLGAQKDYKHQPGKIINISSVGGKIAAPFVGAYSGTKFAMEGMSESLRRELQLYGMDVVIVGPGAVSTPIWDKGIGTTDYTKSNFFNALERFSKHFLSHGKQGDSPEYIAQKIADIFEKKSPKTRYALVKGWFSNWFMPRLLPSRMIDRIIGKRTGLLKR